MPSTCGKKKERGGGLDGELSDNVPAEDTDVLQGRGPLIKRAGHVAGFEERGNGIEGDLETIMSGGDTDDRERLTGSSPGLNLCGVEVGCKAGPDSVLGTPSVSQDLMRSSWWTMLGKMWPSLIPSATSSSQTSGLRVAGMTGGIGLWGKPLLANSAALQFSSTSG